MNNYNKSLIALSLSSAFAFSIANDFYAIIDVDSTSIKTGTIEKNISEWTNTGSEFNCTDWSPDTSTIDFGLLFEQNNVCDQTQSRTKDIYTVYNTGEEVYEETKTELQTIKTNNTQEVTGTKNFTENERADSWSDWSDTGLNYDCMSWSPENNTIDFGESFIQTRDCSQDQEKTRNIYDVWADGTETLNRVEVAKQTIIEQEIQNSVGTKNIILTERETAWSVWSDNGVNYNCQIWTPDTDTIDYGNAFEQTRDCSQDQIRSREIYDVWSDGSETLNRLETENQTIIEEESQNATGIKNFTENERADSWSAWNDTGTHHSCQSWTPNANIIDYGDSFTQTRDCSQDQERTRNVYDVWADGSETFNRTETESQIITEVESQNAIGTKNFIDTTRNGAWSIWNDTGSHYSCNSWTPLTSTVDYGDSFTQTRDCSQNQERTRTVYNVWADGSETVKTTETENKTIIETESQSAIGTKNFTENERADSWSSWSNTGGHYDCQTWNPNANTIDYGDSFTQTRDCSQNQERTRNVYDVWADGSETFNREESESQTITEVESQNAIGTKNFIDTTRNGAWSSWSNTGTHHSCQSWTPNVNTVDYGDSFTQTRDCSQDQESSRNVYDVWADGSETLKTTETKAQTITEIESQNAIGTKNFIDTTRNGAWSSWSDSGSHHSCQSWTPNANTVDYGDSFTQTRDCSQNQTRTRTIYNVWADGSETVKTTETGTQTITEVESQNAIGTKNYKDTVRYDNWSGWSDVNSHYACGSWNPETTTINYGDNFTQNRDCSQDQERTRNVYDVWADGSETLKTIETGTQTITEVESQNAIGTKNFIDTTRNGAWSSWSDSGTHYSCQSWTPNVSTINLGDSFTQTRDCSQNQTRTRTIYNVWADGSETVKTTETGTQTITETESQSATGTKNYITGTDNSSWSGWSNSGGLHSCSAWSPATSTVKQGVSFTQSQNCSQNQTRTRTVYNVWADGSKTVKTTETGSQTISVNQTRTATGTNNSGSWVKYSSQAVQGCQPVNAAPTGSCTLGSKYDQCTTKPAGYGGVYVDKWECR